MSKSSKACKYTGKMHIMNRQNMTKTIFEGHQNELHQVHEQQNLPNPCQCSKLNKGKKS